MDRREGPFCGGALLASRLGWTACFVLVRRDFAVLGFFRSTVARMVALLLYINDTVRKSKVVLDVC